MINAVMEARGALGKGKRMSRKKGGGWWRERDRNRDRETVLGIEGGREGRGKRETACGSTACLLHMDPRLHVRLCVCLLFE